MNTARTHRFHTRHDFTPAPALDLYEAIRALASKDGFVAHAEVRDALAIMASPLKERRDLSKVLASLSDLGLIEIFRDGIRYIPDVGQRLFGNRLWRRRFVSLVHGLYALGHQGPIADPRWSYREVCRILTEHAPGGLSPDDLVMEVVQRARIRFGTERVSFSRSSIGGVKAWLEALDPPVLNDRDVCGISLADAPRSSTLIGDVLETALYLSRGDLTLDDRTLADLGAAMLVPPQQVRYEIEKFIEPGLGLALLDEESPRLWRITIGEPYGRYAAEGNAIG